MKTTRYSGLLIRRIIQLFISVLVLMGWLPPAQANMSNAPLVQQRIDKIRQRLLDVDAAGLSAKPEIENQYIAQWYNWPNWPNWGNWGNWPNYWMNY